MMLVEFKSDEAMWYDAYLDSGRQNVEHRLIKSVEFLWPVEDESPYCEAFLKLDERLEDLSIQKDARSTQEIMATSWISESIDLEVRCLEITSTLRAAVRT